FSEASRLYPVERDYSEVMANPGAEQTGLPAVQQELENSWTAISDWTREILNDPTTAALAVGTLLTIHNLLELRSTVPLIKGPRAT
ncbi:hypothetical protein AB0L10_43130, partial [Streptomyces flaveolus]|uniref:hypothetical protein n=1 Tax=Streptomyces flaveolus TaxID=67297 RepID=UPI00343F1D6D